MDRRADYLRRQPPRGQPLVLQGTRSPAIVHPSEPSGPICFSLCGHHLQARLQEFSSCLGSPGSEPRKFLHHSAPPLHRSHRRHRSHLSRRGHRSHVSLSLTRSLSLSHTVSHSLTLSHTLTHFLVHSLSLALSHTSLSLSQTLSHSLTLSHTLLHSLTLSHTLSLSLSHSHSTHGAQRSTVRCVTGGFKLLRNAALRPFAPCLSFQTDRGVSFRRRPSLPRQHVFSETGGVDEREQLDQ